MKRLILPVLMAALPLIAADRVTGTYAADVRELASGLVLRADQSFEYFFSYGAADYSAKGTWRKDGDSVYLTSAGAEAKPLRVLRTAPGAPGTPLVHVVASNGRGVQHIEVTLATSTGTMTSRTSENGTAEFEGPGAVKSVSVHVPVYDIDAGPFEIAGGANDIWLEINGDAITRLNFKEEPLKLVNGSLEMSFWKGDKPIRYEKQ